MAHIIFFGSILIILLLILIIVVGSENRNYSFRKISDARSKKSATKQAISRQ
jgi:hypothetical protein